MKVRLCRVKLGERSYFILVGWGILRKAGEFIRKSIKGNAPFIITSKTVNKLYYNILKDSLSTYYRDIEKIIIPDGEKAKDIHWWIKAIERLTSYDEMLERECFVVNLGGGVVGDLGGFVASTYRRGIPYVQIPTTLLAMADSGVGGKTAIDIRRKGMTIKNKVGTIYQPSMVICDVSTLKTLEKREVLNGLSEVIKHAILFSKDFYNYIKKNLKTILNLKREVIMEAVFWSYKIKAKVVSEDEREIKGIRTLLNLGHTIGHAIEGASNQRLKHGEAISIGIVCACDLSVKLGFMKREKAYEIEALFKNAGLPTQIEHIRKEKIMTLLLHDKKFKGGKTRLVLLRDVGKPEIVEGINLELIEETIEKRIV